MTVPDRPGPPGAGLFVLVAGWPGSGKSTLAAALATRLGVPLLAKDEIKEALMDALGRPQTVAGSQRLGRAAVLALLRVARRCPGAVLDSTWFDYALPAARALPGQLVEVHCTLPRDLARARYQARARRRHAGHLDTERTDQELWGEPPPSPGLGPVIEVDTSAAVDLDQLLAQLDQVRRGWLVFLWGEATSGRAAAYLAAEKKHSPARKGTPEGATPRYRQAGAVPRRARRPAAARGEAADG